MSITSAKFSLIRHFSLVSGATFFGKVRALIEPVVDGCVKGFSHEIQKTGDRAVETFINTRGRQAISRMGVYATPGIDDLKAKVVVDSSNWTGRNFTGITPPQVIINASNIFAASLPSIRIKVFG